MSVTIQGTQIVFNDGTTQSTAGGAVNTTTVLNATASASTGSVGSYAFLARPYGWDGSYTAGTTVAGSTLRYAGAVSYAGNAGGGAVSVTAPAGTWRCMGYAYGNTDPCSGPYISAGTVWLRIS